MMPFLKFAAALLAAVSAPVLAQQALPTPQPVEAETAAAPLRPALWKVADADTTIYLFGTIHLLPAGKNWYHGDLAAAFEQSGELVTEIPEVDPAQSQKVLLARGVLPPGKTLRGLFSKKEKAAYEAALKAYGIPPAAFDRFKPWYAAVVLSTLPLAREGYDIGSGVEAQLHEFSKARSVPRSGLETLDYQLGLFDSLPAKVQKRYLLEVIAVMPTITRDINRMVDAWGNGDPATLAKLMNDMQDDPALVKSLLTDRNRAWASWIKNRLAQPGTVFVAVGAGHLGGKDSVQDLLGTHGLAAERVQ